MSGGSIFNNASRWLSGGRASSAPNAKAVELGHRLLEELAVRLVSRRRRRRGGRGRAHDAVALDETFPLRVLLSEEN